MGYYCVLIRTENKLTPATIAKLIANGVEVIQVDEVIQSFFEDAQKTFLMSGCVEATINRYKSDKALAQVFGD